MPKHARSREGCGACKEKRIKCDETRPWCRNCQGRDIQCPGFTRQLRWKMTSVSLDAVRKRPRKTLVKQPASWSTLDGFTQAPAERLGADPSSSQLMVVDESWRPQLNMQDSQGDANHSQSRHDQVPFHVPPAAEINPQMSTLDEGSTSMSKSEQYHEFDIALIASPMESCVLEHVSPQRFTVCDDYLDQTEVFPSTTSLADESYPHTVGSSARVLSGDISASRQTSPEESRDSPKDPWQTLILDTTNATIGPPSGDAWPSFIEQQSAGDLDFDTYAAAAAAAAEVGQRGVESGSLSLSSTVWQHNFCMEAETENILMGHYFNHICQIMSCFDSRQNPFRKYIPRIMLSCEYVNECVASLSAAHLANSTCGMDGVAVGHQTKAMRGLMSVLQAIQYSSHHKSSDNGLSRLSVTFARYQALLATLLLGISAPWYDASATGLPHHHGARLLFQAWLVDEGIDNTPKESVLLDHEQSFIIGAMTYLECLVSIIIDQPVESLNYQLRFATLSLERRVYPNPWTGISTPLFAYLAESITLARQKRCSISRERRSDIGPQISRRARELYGLVLAHRPPLVILVDDTQDANTPLSHLFAMDTILRLTILLELIQVFPELLMDDHSTSKVRQKCLDLAIAVTTIISDLPESSGTNSMLSIPLLSAGSALQAIESIPGNIHHGYDLSSNSLDALCGQIAVLMRRPATLQIWRDQVSCRVEQLYHRVNLAPVKRISAILEAVWHQADEASNYDTSIPGKMIHWMDVMIEGGLETLFG